MRQSNRLILNAASMFGRMAFTVGIGLLITRLLLNWLGTIDFGLVIVLGATGALLEVVSASLATSVQRQLAYEIGRNNLHRLGAVFSTAWVVFLGMGLGLWLVGQALTPVVMHSLTIPPERAAAAWWVYQITLLNVILAVTATPFRAMTIAHQHLTVIAITDAATAVMRLAAVLLMLIVPWDRMVAFVAFQLAGYAAVRWALNAYCLWRYEGCWPKLQDFDRLELKRIIPIAGWTLVGDVSWRLRMQGGVLLLNVFFGPAVNAAYGISVQLASYIINLASSLRLIVFPAMVSSHAIGNQQNVQRLVLVTGKYAVLLLSLLFVPLLYEANFVLRAWLGELPPFTLEFARLVVIWSLVYVFSVGYVLALVAVGNIGWYTRQTLLYSALILIISGIGFLFGCAPWFLPAVTLIGVLLLMAIAVVSIGAKIELPPSRWCREALLPTIGVLIPAIIAASAAHWSMAAGFWRLVVVTAVYGLVAAPLIWWVALATWERQQFLRFAASAIARLRQARIERH